jgi:transposase InsO family protein
LKVKVPNWEHTCVFYLYPFNNGKILLSGVEAKELGIYVSGIPTRFVEEEEEEHDLVWAKEEEKAEEFVKEEDREKIREGVKKNFAENAKLPNNTHCTHPRALHNIEIEDSEIPVCTRQYRIPQKFVEMTGETMNEWEENTWIEEDEAGNSWCSPINPQPKVSGGIIDEKKVRVCVDFRGPNLKARKIQHTIPTSRDVFEKIRGFDILSEVDLKAAYHLILLNARSKKFTAFINPATGKKMRFNRMFFGEKGAAHTMQRVVEMILKEEGLDEWTAAYVDNILIFTKGGPEAHAEVLGKVIDALTKWGMKMNVDKCQVGMKKARVLGHLISNETATVDPVKSDTLKNLTRPKKGTQVESFLGFTNFLRDYIPMYASIAGPIEALRKAKSITDEQWEGEPKRAFELIKGVLGKAPIMHMPDWTRPFKVGTDSSQYGVGAVLYQVMENGEIRYVAFAAKSLNKHQRNYPAIKRELLAIVFAVAKWREVLWGNKFILETDHKALTYMANSSQRMIRDWMHVMGEMDFEVVHKPGFLNILPHHLSHMYDMLEVDSKRDNQSEEGSTKEVDELEVDWQSDKGVEKWRKEVMESMTGKLLTPEGSRREMVEAMHMNSHVGPDGLFRAVFRAGHYWPKMMKDCREVAGSCDQCLRYNVGRHGFHPLSTLKAQLPWDHVAMDLLGPFPTSGGGYNFVLIMVDVATRFVVLRSLRVKTMEGIAWELAKIFADFGVPKILQCDNDPSFVNQVLDEMKEKCGFERRMVLPYHPETNGIVERYVGEVKQVLKKRLRGDWKDWEKLVPATQLALNERILSRHMSSPFSLMFARRLNGFGDYREVEKADESEEEKVARLAERSRVMGEVIFPEIARVSEEKGKAACEKKNSKRRQIVKKLKVGTRVMVKIEIREDGQEERYEGPFTVVGYSEKDKGYRLIDNQSKLLGRGVAVSKIKVIQEKEAMNQDKHWEVKRVVGHRGEMEGREFEVEWKGGGENEFVRAADFGSNKCIKDYWKERVKEAKSKEKKRQSEEKAVKLKNRKEEKKKKAVKAKNQEEEEEQQGEGGNKKQKEESGESEDEEKKVEKEAGENTNEEKKIEEEAKEREEQGEKEEEEEEEGRGEAEKGNSDNEGKKKAGGKRNGGRKKAEKRKKKLLQGSEKGIRKQEEEDYELAWEMGREEVAGESEEVRTSRKGRKIVAKRKWS